MTASTGHEEAFQEHRKLLFGVAYRMVGSAADAEDLVQETYLRWRQAPRDEITSPRAYLTTIVTRLAIDQLKSARAQRETYVGPWLPEPVHDAPAPDDPAAFAESLSIAFLVMLERLAPVERAALLLRDVFEYEYAELAAVLGKSEANCRQIVRRARERVADRRPRFVPSREERDRLAVQFMAAVRTGDMAGLLGALSENVTLLSDGGGKVAAATQPIVGPDRVVRFLLGLMKKAPPSFAARPVEVNGEPGFILTVDGQVHSVLAVHVGPTGIEGLYFVRNPDKLASFPGV